MALTWKLWTYAILPGWEITGDYATRAEARDVRDYLVVDERYEPDWVVVRKHPEAPKWKPSQASIARMLEGQEDD